MLGTGSLMNTGLFRPRSVDEAIELLARLPEAKILSGGATLVAMINARLIEPLALISLADVGELAGVTGSPGGGWRIGAMTRHRDVAAETRFTGTLGLVQQAASLIANATVRNMGTIGGAIAHADPGLDYPPALVAADATIEVASGAGRRRIPAQDFFVDWYTTALGSGELVVAVHLPPAQPGAGVYHKFARVSGDYATVSVAISISAAANGARARAAVGACGPAPVLLDEANALLSGRPGEADIARAGELLAAAADPVDDVRGSAGYRRLLIPRMLARAFAEARAGMGARQ